MTSSSNKETYTTPRISEYEIKTDCVLLEKHFKVWVVHGEFTDFLVISIHLYTGLIILIYSTKDFIVVYIFLNIYKGRPTES
jgi:hypothetical protein